MSGIKMQSNYDKNMLEWLVFKDMVALFEKDVTFEDNPSTFATYAAYSCGYSKRIMHIYLLNLVDTTSILEAWTGHSIVYFLMQSPEFNNWMEDIYIKYRS